MENQQPAGKAQIENSQKKWYKTWWGIMLIIIILPIAAIYYIWSKTKWSKTKKWIATGVVVLITIGIFGNKNNKSDDNQKPQQQVSAPTTQAASEQKATPQAPKFVFDVPSLFGKNIDEIKSVLGDPSNFKAPTSKELATTSNYWEMDFVKNDVDLNVSYNPKTKFVYDFFIGGNDKQKLLTEGNVNENSNDYSIEVEQAPSNNDVTGITIAKKLPDSLDASISYGLGGVKITNNEDYSWGNCEVNINPGFLNSGYSDKFDNVEPKSSKSISFLDFAKDGQRFNILAEKPGSICVTCDTGIQKARIGCGSFN